MWSRGGLQALKICLIVKFQEKRWNLQNGQLGTQVDNVADPLVESPEKVLRDLLIIIIVFKVIIIFKIKVVIRSLFWSGSRSAGSVLPGHRALAKLGQEEVQQVIGDCELVMVIDWWFVISDGDQLTQSSTTQAGKPLHGGEWPTKPSKVVSCNSMKTWMSSAIVWKPGCLLPLPENLDVSSDCLKTWMSLSCES